jgi:hypothetical protein
MDAIVREEGAGGEATDVYLNPLYALGRAEPPLLAGCPVATFNITAAPSPTSTTQVRIAQGTNTAEAPGERKLRRCGSMADVRQLLVHISSVALTPPRYRANIPKEGEQLSEEISETSDWSVLF